MASTTLVTFLFQSPQQVSRVELLGSWDNFTKAWPMQRDKIVSSRSWKGCHYFSEIVCDGDVLAMDGSTREGGLQMGGTYWYYYRLDDEVECHDPMVTSTRACPFLPGQEVNILEVPIQEDSVTIGSASPLQDVFTMDPAARFLTPKRSISPLPENTERDRSSVLPITSVVRRASSLRNTFLSTMPKFSLARSRTLPNRRANTSASVSKIPVRHEQIRPFSESDTKMLRNDWLSHADSPIINQTSLDDTAPQTFLSTEDSYDTESLSDFDDMASDVICLESHDAISLYSEDDPTDRIKEATESHATQDNTTPVVECEGPTSISDRTSGFFSLLSDSIVDSTFATNRHSYFHGQPQTPTLDFDGFTLEPFQLDFGRLDSSMATGTSTEDTPLEIEPDMRPAKECSSSPTLQHTTSSFKDLNHTAKLSPLEKLDMVESWRHGESPSTVSEHEPSTLQNLINDLGYLSSLID